MNNKILYSCLDSSKIKSPQKEFRQHHNKLQPIQLICQNHCQGLSLRLRKLEILTARSPFQVPKRPLWTSSVGLRDFCKRSRLIVTFLLALSGPRLPLVMSWLCLIFNTLKKQNRWLGFSARIYRALSDKDFIWYLFQSEANWPDQKISVTYRLSEDNFGCLFENPFLKGASRHQQTKQRPAILQESSVQIH